MLKNVLGKSLYDRRRSLLWWAIGSSLLVMWYNLMYLSLDQQAMAGLTQMMESDLLKGLMGVAPDLTDPVGWLEVELLPLLGPLIIIIFSVSYANSALVKEEQEGTLSLLLSTPVSRTAVFAQKLAGLFATVTFLGTVFWLANVLSTSIADMGISFLALGKVSFSLILLGLLFGTFSLALGAVAGKKGLSVGLTSAAAAGLYLLNSMAAIFEPLEPYRVLSPFYYYDGAGVIREGLSLANVGVMLAAILLFVLIGLYGFRRRDIGT